MAKTIKFNLICDGVPVRTLDDLRNNFLIEDVITYFNNKLLHRWLQVRGYDDKLEKIENLKSLNTLELIKKLIIIFDVEADPAVIEENTYILEYKEESKLLLDEYERQSFKVSTILDDYHKGYLQLIDSIIENKEDIAIIKAAIKEINKSYFELYELDYRNVFYTFLENAPLAIFVMLMNENMREKYLLTKSEVTKDSKLSIKKDNTVLRIPEMKKVVSDDIDKINDTSIQDKVGMYNKICELLLNKSELSKLLGENLKMFAGETDGYWKDIELKEKKYMILSMDRGSYVRSAGALGFDLGYDDIKNKFMILEGIDYKSNNAYHELYYMEV